MKLRMATWAALAALLAGCSTDTFEGKGVAEAEVTRFHERLQAKEFDAIYDNTGQEFRAAAPKDKVMALFAAIDRKLGPLQGTEQINWNVNTWNLVTTVTLVYGTTFRDGDATETFTFRVADGKPQLVGYNVASLDMLIK